MCELTKPWYNSVGHKTKQNYMNVRNTFVRKSKAGAEEKQKKETCWRRAIRLLQSDTGNLKHWEGCDYFVLLVLEVLLLHCFFVCCKRT